MPLRIGDKSVHLIQCHVKKTVWDYWNFVTWCIILLEAAMRSWVQCGDERWWTWSATILVQGAEFKLCPKCEEPKVCQENIPHTIIAPPPLAPCFWYKTGWIHVSIFFTQNCDPTDRQQFSSLLLLKWSSQMILTCMHISVYISVVYFHYSDKVHAQRR